MHLERRGHTAADLNIDHMVLASDGFSGAEIEAAIVGALYRSLERETALDTDMVLEELKATVPLSHSRAEDIEALREWARTRAVRA